MGIVADSGVALTTYLQLKQIFGRPATSDPLMARKRGGKMVWALMPHTTEALGRETLDR